MTDRQGRSLEFERRIHENLANFFNARNHLLAQPDRLRLSDSDESERETTAVMEEIPLPPNHFHDAIIELPLPPAVKRFLLFIKLQIKNVSLKLANILTVFFCRFCGMEKICFLSCCKACLSSYGYA